jgi:L-rhamnose mutarotase
METLRYCFALDLIDDERLIADYVHYHKPDVIWPEVVAGIKECNIIDMNIYLAGNRLLMILETNTDFNLERDFERMGTLSRQKDWAELMRTFQKQLRFAKQNEQWVLMKQIFNLNA